MDNNAADDQNQPDRDEGRRRRACGGTMTPRMAVALISAFQLFAVTFLLVNLADDEVLNDFNEETGTHNDPELQKLLEEMDESYGVFHVVGIFLTALSAVMALLATVADRNAWYKTTIIPRAFLIACSVGLALYFPLIGETPFRDDVKTFCQFSKDEFPAGHDCPMVARKMMWVQWIIGVALNIYVVHLCLNYPAPPQLPPQQAVHPQYLQPQQLLQQQVGGQIQPQPQLQARRAFWIPKHRYIPENRCLCFTLRQGVVCWSSCLLAVFLSSVVRGSDLWTSKVAWSGSFFCIVGIFGGLKKNRVSVEIFFVHQLIFFLGVSYTLIKDLLGPLVVDASLVEGIISQCQKQALQFDLPKDEMALMKEFCADWCFTFAVGLTVALIAIVLLAYLWTTSISWRFLLLLEEEHRQKMIQPVPPVQPGGVYNPYAAYQQQYAAQLQAYMNQQHPPAAGSPASQPPTHNQAQAAAAAYYAPQHFQYQQPYAAQYQPQQPQQQQQPQVHQTTTQVNPPPAGVPPPEGDDGGEDEGHADSEEEKYPAPQADLRHRTIHQQQGQQQQPAQTQTQQAPQSQPQPQQQPHHPYYQYPHQPQQAMYNPYGYGVDPYGYGAYYQYQLTQQQYAQMLQQQTQAQQQQMQQVQQQQQQHQHQHHE